MIFIKLLLLLSVSLINDSNCEERVYVRKSAKNYSYSEWTELKKTIRIMKGMNDLNPLSFQFQANIHGWKEYDGSAYADYMADLYNWHKCSHEHYFFLVWHRMYLYFFERILKKVSNNPNLTVPYWDYSDPDQRDLPRPFRIPADNKTNPLYVSQRCKNVNDGEPLLEKITDPLPALRSRFFTTNQTNELNVCHSFGGGRIDKPMFESHREGLLERLPHDRIHVHVGGPGGHMADLCTAAMDPIFWLHHAMIDRVWESWQQMGGQHLMEPSYLDTTFKFHDENGKLGTHAVKDFLNITNLKYRYDSLLKAEKDMQTISDETPELFISVDETKDLHINSTKHSINLKIKPKYLSLFEDIAKGEVDKERVRFTLQTVLDITYSGLIFELYMNLPKQTVPYESRANNIGAITLFEAKCIPKNNRKFLGLTHCFDITDNLFTVLKNDYNYNGIVPKQLILTIVPKSCDSVYYPSTEQYIIKFKRTLLIHHYI